MPEGGFDLAKSDGRSFDLLAASRQPFDLLDKPGPLPGDLANLLRHRKDLIPHDWLPPVQLSDSQVQAKVLQAAQAEGKTAKLESLPAASAAAREHTLWQLSSDSERSKLDLLCLQLAFSTSAAEKTAKQSEIGNFLKSKLGDKSFDEALKSVVSTAAPAELLSEIAGSRPYATSEVLKQARADLLSHAEQSITDGGKLRVFQNNLTDFDSRAAKHGVAPAEQLQLYLQLDRLLNPALKFEQGDKSLLARSLLANAADPTSIDQGGHNTCNVTTLECRLFTQEPGTAAKVVADVVCAGQFVAADGTKVRPLNLEPDNEAKEDPTRDGARNYASQIWQLTAINTYWNRRDSLPGGKTVGKGNIEYAQGDGSEFLLDMTTNPPKKQQFSTIDSDNPWLDVYGVSQINEQITGRPSKNLGVVRWFYPSENDGVRKIVTLNGFKEHLSELKEQKAFPVIIEVDAAKKPFGDGKGYGPHVVTITDYDPASGLLTVDNQWGKRNDQTGLPGEKPKPSVEEIWGSMNQIPGMDFYYNTIKKDLKDVQLKDAVQPTIAALSTKGLTWGLPGAAALAVREGLGSLSQWGTPAAAELLSASEGKWGSLALRGGTGLAALGVFAYANDLPGAFKDGAAHGAGKLTRVAGDYLSFQLAEQLSSRVIGLTGLWAPARIGLALAAGMASSTVFDRLLGEGAEVAGSEGYNRARDFISPRGTLSNPEKAIKQETSAAAVALNLAQLGDLGKQRSLTDLFIERHLAFQRLLNGG